MAEKEAPEFTVVDRRRSAAAGPPPAPEAPEATTPNEREEPEPAAGAESDSLHTGQDSAADPFGLPDPALLVAMAAMQTTPQEMLGLLAPAFDSQARKALGLIADSQTGELSQNLDAAKIAIDAVQFCLNKAETTLEPAEAREMARRLNDLRLTFVARRQTP